MSSLFLTGAGGLVGRRVLEAIDPARWEAITLLAKRDLELPERLAGRAGVRLIRSDLAADDRYREALSPTTRILHLAARTGGGAPADHERDNVAGTQHLLGAATQAGIRRFVHVSTVAVRFPDHDGYPYAASKARAEAAVLSSGLPHTIVRPTIVLSREGGPWGRLRALCRGRLTIVPGTGETKLQPIHVDDLARVLLWACDADELVGSRFDAGGADVRTTAGFLRLASRTIHGRDVRQVRVPLGSVRTVLRAADRAAGGRLPVAPGQLSAFRFDTHVERPPPGEPPAVRGIEEILTALV